MVRESFLHSWEGYKQHAWLQDEVTPLYGTYNNGFGGWGATLVDTLDTLWIMGLKKEFVVVLAALKKINFSSTPLDTVNVFETTIRYLGGFLSAYDISGAKYPALLEKAVEPGEMLCVAFDTPNQIGLLSLEFTRLSRLSGDHKYYDAVQRISDVSEHQQNKTKIPGI
ncbi:glutamine-dependent NAD(+) synthetase [Elasticomyces elasticus]|nr:glutamine-dependent NAD(+) synthetase [Elasticomyces elasticus]